MPKTLVWALAALSFATAGLARADESGGFYFGGSLGAGVSQSTGTLTSLPVHITPFSRSETSPRPEIAPQASLLLGWDKRLGERWLAGLEGEATVQGARGAWSATSNSGLFGGHGSELTDIASSSVWSVPFQAALRARVAFALTPSISLYGGVGPALGYARLQSSVDERDHGGFVFFGFYDSRTHSEFARRSWTPGLSVDAGLEAALGQGFSLRAGYELTAFQPVSLGFVLPGAPPNSGEMRATPLLQSVRLGLVKHF